MSHVLHAHADVAIDMRRRRRYMSALRPRGNNVTTTRQDATLWSVAACGWAVRTTSSWDDIAEAARLIDVRVLLW